MSGKICACNWRMEEKRKPQYVTDTVDHEIHARTLLTPVSCRNHFILDRITLTTQTFLHTVLRHCDA